MRSLFDAPVRAEIQDRLSRLAPGTRGLWGRMSAPQMLAHVADQLRLALGDIEPGRSEPPSATRFCGS